MADGAPVNTSPSQPIVTFALNKSSVKEDAGTASLTVNLSAASNQTVTVNYAATGGIANEIDRGSGKDYTLKQGTLTFKPGTVTQKISIPLTDDALNEVDEPLEITLSNPRNAALDANVSHTATILDNDRKVMVDVREFGAIGDGITDDTQAIQKAIDTVSSQGGGVIVFSPGKYLVSSVKLKDNITYSGYGATIKRPDNQNKTTRTFVAEYAGEGNSKPLIVQGLTFDGNSQNQGSYRDYELEQAHLIFLEGNPNFPGKLQAFIEDTTFKNGVADGIAVYTNVDAKVDNVEAVDVFRGGFVLTGGNSSAEVHDLTTRGKIDDTGIDIEVDGRGFGDTLKVDVKLENLNLINGDFDIAVEEGSIVTGNNIFADSPFFLFGLDSTMKFTNSQFKVGAADGLTNRIVFPNDLTFENSKFFVTRKETGEPFDFFSAADIWWQVPGFSTQQNQRLAFKNSLFEVDRNIKETDTTYAIHLRKDSPANKNQLILDGVDFSNNFDEEIVGRSNSASVVQSVPKPASYAIGLREDSPANNDRLILDGVELSNNFDAAIANRSNTDSPAQSIPEPASVLAILALGALALFCHPKQRKKVK
jgi:hypothetical protein